MVKFDANPVLTHKEIDEINLFKCTSLSFYNSAVEKFDPCYVVNLVLLVTEGSEI